MPPRLPSFRAPYICSRCLQRRQISTSDASSPPPPPPPSGAVRLTNRRLISAHGADAAHFLHGITTATVRPGQTTCFYSSFLNAQGRVLNDVFVYPAAHSREYATKFLETSKPDPDTPAYFIEVDASEADTLLKHLKRYKLRAKVNLRLVDEQAWSVWSVWDESEPWTPHPSPAPSSSSSTSPTPAPSSPPANPNPTPTSSSHHPHDGTIGGVDGRAPGMGRRLVLPGTAFAPPPSSSSPIHETSLAAYTVRRLLRGVAEGQAEIPREHALPQESNIDFMGGIDFRKGCYVGQELTIRTHHTGVVRKRILPVALYGPAVTAVTADGMQETSPDALAYDAGAPLAEHLAPAPWANIVPVGRSGRSAGKWIGGVANVGLAQCRIEMMTDMVLTGEGSRWNPDDEFRIKQDGEGSHAPELKVKAFVPEWVRSRIKIRHQNRQV